jgi:hypothetical protein
VMIGALVGGLVTIKLYGTCIISFFDRLSRATTAPPGMETDSP